MKKPVKVVAWIAGIVVVLIVALIVLAKIVITPERVKDTVLPIAEKSLQRKIELGDISVSILSGIELHDLKVYEADGKTTFVSTDLVQLKYQLLPLLSMKVVVDEVTVVKPMIQVTRFADGRFSFDDLVKGNDKADNKSKVESSSISTPIDLLVSTVSLSNGTLAFTDYQINPNNPFRTEISSLDVAAEGITLTGNIPVSASCLIDNGSLSADGSISLAGSTADMNIKLVGVDVVKYSPYFKDAIPGQLGGLSLALETKVSGGLDKVSASGTLKGDGLNLVLNALPDAPLSNARVALTYDVGVDFNGGTLDLRSARLDFNGLAAEAAGKVDKIFTVPGLDLKLSLPGIDLQQAMKSVPAKLTEGVRDLDLSGRVSATAQLSGSIDADPVKLLKNTVVTLDNVQASGGGQRPALVGKVKLADQQLVSEGLEMRLGDNVARINLSASNLFGKMIIVKADVASDQFQLDPLLGTGAASGRAVADKQKTSPGDEIGPFDIPLQASGTISIGKTLYKGLAIDNFVARYKLQDNILTISQLDGYIAGGSFANTARVDLGVKGLVYSADLVIKGIKANPLITAFVPKATGALLGSTNLDFSVKGQGTQWETLSKKLTGQGDLLVADGRVVSPGLVKGVASFLQLSNTDEIRFENFRGNLKIVDGKVQIDSSILSDEIKLFPKGAIGLDGSLNLTMDTRISPKISGRMDTGGKVTQYLTDDEGWSQIPLLVSGSFSSPSFGLDPKGVQSQAKKALGKELGRQVDKMIGSPKTGEAATGSESQQQTQPAEDPAKKLLKEGLKGLFGN